MKIVFILFAIWAASFGHWGTAVLLLLGAMICCRGCDKKESEGEDGK